MRQRVIVALVLLALIIDGLDIQLLSLAAPLILSEWSLPRAEFGAPMAAALIGMSMGAGIGGWFGDRVGRKTALVSSTLLFGVATLAASLTHDSYEMTVARLISGIGFGAAQPNGIALVTEWLPERARTRAIGLLSVGTPLGGMIGAGTLIWLLPLFGWRGTFVACGTLTVLIAALMILGLPKAGDIPQVGEAPAKTHSPSLPAGGIFTRENLRLNTGVWLIFFGITFVAYALAAWTPVLLTTIGFTLPQALRGSLAFNISAVIAAIVTGFLLSRLGSRILIAASCLGTLASVAIMAAAAHVAASSATEALLGVLLVTCAGAGGCTGAAIASVYALLASSYPVACRSGGIGFGMMMGRLGAIASTFSGGALLSIQGRNTLPFFLALGLWATLAFAGLFIVDRHLPRSRR